MGNVVDFMPHKLNDRAINAILKIDEGVKELLDIPTEATLAAQVQKVDDKEIHNGEEALCLLIRQLLDYHHAMQSQRRANSFVADLMLNGRIRP